MLKLIERFKAEPNAANWERLKNYMHKHPMAVCMLSTSDVAFLYQNKLKFEN